MRHKWNGGKLPDKCKVCGCVKENIKGVLTYFYGDTIVYKAPKCETK